MGTLDRTGLEPPAGNAAEIVVEVVRSGGFAGLVRRGRTSVRGLEERGLVTEAEQLRVLVAAVDLDELQRGRLAAERGADRYLYEICVRVGDRQVRTEVREEQMTEPLRRLSTAVLATDLPGGGSARPRSL